MRPIAARVGIFYHADPAGDIPSGIDSFIRGILQWAPPDLEYTLFGATSDVAARPVGRQSTVTLGGREVRYWPLVRVQATASRSIVPLTVQYMWALERARRANLTAQLDILDFHRIEPSFLFRHESRPRNVILHQDMSVIRDRNSDIKWRHFPWLYEQVEGALFKQMDRIYSVRESAVSRYTKIYPHMARKFAFIPTWVDTGIFHPRRDRQPGASDSADVRREMGLAAATRLLVFVGRLDRQKDPLLLLDAFQNALSDRIDLHLVIIGDGALRSEVEAASRSAGLRGRVTLMGALSRREIAGMLRSADLFVMSSAYEGMPIAVLEALATGLPVVSTDVGEMRRVVHSGTNGYLSERRTARALSEAMLLALNRLDDISGTPCENSVLPYHPGTVLNQIYDNHRRQAQRSPT